MPASKVLAPPIATFNENGEPAGLVDMAIESSSTARSAISSGRAHLTVTLSWNNAACSALQPQHLARPSFDEIDGTPSTGLSVTSEPPVLKKSRPGLGLGFSPVLAYFTAASTPIDAINSGYCWAVAPM